MNTTTLEQFIVCKNDGTYLSAKANVWEREFTSNPSEARVYNSEATARKTLINYFSDTLDCVALGKVNRTIEVDVIKLPKFDSKEDLFKEEIDHFGILNAAYNVDADAMTDTEYHNWGNLKRILHTQSIIDRNSSGKWVFV